MLSWETGDVCTSNKFQWGWLLQYMRRDTYEKPQLYCKLEQEIFSNTGQIFALWLDLLTLKCWTHSYKLLIGGNYNCYCYSKMKHVSSDTVIRVRVTPDTVIRVWVILFVVNAVGCKLYLSIWSSLCLGRIQCPVKIQQDRVIVEINQRLLVIACQL